MSTIIDVSLVQAKELADMFLDDNIESEYNRNLATFDNDKMNLLTLELMRLKSKLNELSLHRQAMELGKLSKIMSVCQNSVNEFDEQEQLSTIKRFLELTTVVGEYASFGLENLATIQSKVNFAVKYLIGKTTEELEDNIEINHNIEKAYMSLRRSKNYDEVLGKLIVEPVLYNDELLPSQDFEDIIENNSKFLQSRLPEYNLTLVESLLLYDKVLLRTFSTVSKASRFLLDVCDASGSEETNEHNLWYFSLDNLNKLFDKFDENDLKVDPDIKKWQMFSRTSLRSIRNRIQSSSGYFEKGENGEEVLIDSSELEEDFLMNIITRAPHQLKTFVDFLAKEETIVPLAKDRLPFYLSELVKVADNSTIKKTFIIEHGSEITHIDKYRKGNRAKTPKNHVYTRVRTKNKDE